LANLTQHDEKEDISQALTKPHHRDIRIDSVVGDTIAKTKYSDLQSFESKEMNYNQKLGEERIVRAQKNVNQANHLLEQAKENFY